MSLAANIAARDAHTASLCPLMARPKVRVAKRAHEAAAALSGWVYKQPGMATKDDCEEMYARIYRERGPDDALGLLQRFGIKHIKSLELMRYEDFFKYASTSLYYGASPLFGWTSKEDIRMPMWDRDRFLYHNAKTDRLWQTRGKQGNEIDNPHVVDVSGVPEFEQRYVEQHKPKEEL